MHFERKQFVGESGNVIAGMYPSDGGPPRFFAVNNQTFQLPPNAAILVGNQPVPLLQILFESGKFAVVPSGSFTETYEFDCPGSTPEEAMKSFPEAARAATAACEESVKLRIDQTVEEYKRAALLVRPLNGLPKAGRPQTKFRA